MTDRPPFSPGDVTEKSCLLGSSGPICSLERTLHRRVFFLFFPSAPLQRLCDRDAYQTQASWFEFPFFCFQKVGEVSLYFSGVVDLRTSPLVFSSASPPFELFFAAATICALAFFLLFFNH